MNKYKNRDKLKQILPHREPMILIDRVVAYDFDKRILSTEIDIDESTIFFDKDLKGVPIWVGIEYMAQTIGAFSGIYSTEYKNEEPKLGFILGTRNYDCLKDKFEAGKTYRVDISELFFDDALGSFSCELKQEDDLISKAELSVMQFGTYEEFKEYIKKGQG